MRNAATASQRYWRLHTARHRAKQGYIIPRPRFAYCVELDAIYPPQWALDNAIDGFCVYPDQIWLGRALAKKLAELDRRCGGVPRITKVEYRRCKLCRRPLLGPVATLQRDLDDREPGNDGGCDAWCERVAG